MSRELGTRIFVASVWRGNGSQNFRPRENNRTECLFPKRRNRKPQLVLKAPMVSVFWCVLLVRGFQTENSHPQQKSGDFRGDLRKRLKCRGWNFGWMESRVKRPQLPIYKAIYMGHESEPHCWVVGVHLVGVWFFFPSKLWMFEIASHFRTVNICKSYGWRWEFHWINLVMIFCPCLMFVVFVGVFADLGRRHHNPPYLFQIVKFLAK